MVVMLNRSWNKEYSKIRDCRRVVQRSNPAHDFFFFLYGSLIKNVFTSLKSCKKKETEGEEREGEKEKEKDIGYTREIGSD